MSVAPKTSGLWPTFRWPLAIALVTVVGLLSALIGDGAYDALSWILLGGLLVVIAVLWRRPA